MGSREISGSVWEIEGNGNSQTEQNLVEGPQFSASLVICFFFNAWLLVFGCARSTYDSNVEPRLSFHILFENGGRSCRASFSCGFLVLALCQIIFTHNLFMWIFV